MDNYYLLVGEESIGPLPEERLPEAGLTPTTLVWRDGWNAWRSAADVPELQPWLPAALPAHGNPPYVSPAAEPSFGTQGVPHSGLGMLSLGFGLGGLAIHAIWFVLAIKLAVEAVNQPAAAPQPTEGEALFLGLFVCVGVVVNLLGGLVGLLGLFYSGRRKLLAALGLLANVAPPVLLLLLVLLGMALG